MMRFLQGLVLVGTIDLRPCLLPSISSPGGRGDEITNFRPCHAWMGGVHATAIEPALAAELLIGRQGASLANTQKICISSLCLLTSSL